MKLLTPTPVVIVLAKSRLKIPTSPWVPTKIPLHFEPNASQASSKIGILFFEIANFFHVSQGFPSIGTGMISLVFLIFFFKSFTHIFKLSSISVIIGLAPSAKIASTVATKVKA